VFQLFHESPLASLISPEAKYLTKDNLFPLSTGALNYVEFRAATNPTWFLNTGALNHVRFRASHAPYVVHGGERGIRTLDPVLSGILA
jgi:hypothetical protein